MSLSNTLPTHTSYLTLPPQPTIVTDIRADLTLPTTIPVAVAVATTITTTTTTATTTTTTFAATATTTTTEFNRRMRGGLHQEEEGR